VRPPDQTSSFVQEFVRLRRGWGLEATGLRHRVGPSIARLAALKADGSDQEIRRALRDFVRQMAKPLSEGDQLAIAVALGIEPDSKFPVLADRERVLAGRLSVGERTARRRIARAFDRLAEEALAAQESITGDPDGPDEGWYVRRLEALLRLDMSSPELTETRTIVSSREGLRTISALFSLPRRVEDDPGDRDLFADVQQGARVRRRERQGEAHFRFVLDLPKPLRHGEEHTYTMVFRVPEGQPIRAHYAFVPLITCESFRLHARFDPARLPQSVWRLDRLAPRVLSDRPRPGKPLTLDGAGEILLDFDDLKCGFGYGVAWLPSAESTVTGHESGAAAGDADG
jgi:hypothetical protein